MIKNKIYINDIIVIFLIILICISWTLSLFEEDENSTSEHITIMIGNNIYDEFNLNNDTSVEISDTGVICTIKDGKTSITHSDCPDKSCMHLPDITKDSVSGTSIVCLPNLVSIIKNSSDKSYEGVDVVAY